jgi:hypothetical protein
MFIYIYICIYTYSSSQTNHDCPIIEEYSGSVATSIERIELTAQEFHCGEIGY